MAAEQSVSSIRKRVFSSSESDYSDNISQSDDSVKDKDYVYSSSDSSGSANNSESVSKFICGMFLFNVKFMWHITFAMKFDINRLKLLKTFYKQLLNNHFSGLIFI